MNRTLVILRRHVLYAQKEAKARYDWQQQLLPLTRPLSYKLNDQDYTQRGYAIARHALEQLHQYEALHAHERQTEIRGDRSS